MPKAQHRRIHAREPGAFAVNGEAWQRKFINVYGPAISQDSDGVAAEVQLDICDYALAENADRGRGAFGVSGSGLSRWKPGTC